jgi:hypothetical protein
MSLAPRSYVLLLLGSLSVVAANGCGNARYVVQDQYGGVVAIPSNSNSWPTYYREKAEKLMTQKCPQGYVVDREEEVVVGQTTTANTNSDTRTNDLQGGKRSPSGSLEATTTSRSVSVQDQTEYRIAFHAKNAVPAAVMRPESPRVVLPPSPQSSLPATPVPVAN